MKRHKGKGLSSEPLPFTSTTNDSNRSALVSPNIFSAVQSTSNNSMPQTATRNPSTVAPAAKKSSSSSLASLLTSSAAPTPNGTSQYNTPSMDAYNFGDISPTKQTKATKATAAKNNNIGNGAEPTRRAPATPGTGVKR